MQTDQFYALAKGALTYVPGLYSTLRRRHTGGTDSAEYCRRVWLKHLAWSGLTTPRTVAELGPGDSVGCGIAAILSGAERYHGIDARPSANPERNRKIARELGADPDVLQCLSSSNPEPDSVDFLFSHSVLEHVADLPAVTRDTWRWLKPGAVMSHQFDLESHGVTRTWDGHRAFSNEAWRMVVGRRPFLINRLPYSTILQTIEAAGFEIVSAQRLRKTPTVPRRTLRGKWQTVSDDDLETFGGIVQARKP